jgi:hypothetical protein
VLKSDVSIICNTQKKTHRFKGSNFRRVVLRRKVVNSHAALGSFKELIRYQRNPSECPITCTEVEDSSPIVGGIFAEDTGSTGRFGRNIIGRVHGCIERVLVPLDGDI